MLVKEIVTGLNDLQQDANTRRRHHNLAQINYIAIKSPFVNNKSTTVDIAKLKIDDIESLYNIQNIKIGEQFRAHTTIFSDLDFLLSTDLILENDNIQLKKTQEIQLLSEKVPFNSLNKKHKKIKQDLRHNLLLTDLNSSLNRSLDENEINQTQNSLIIDEEIMPEYCRLCVQNQQSRHENNCIKHCYYEVEQLETLEKNRLLAELENHHHPKSLRSKTSKKFLGVQNLRNILIQHYKSFHRK